MAHFGRQLPLVPVTISVYQKRTRGSALAVLLWSALSAEIFY